MQTVAQMILKNLRGRQRKKEHGKNNVEVRDSRIVI